MRKYILPLILIFALLFVSVGECAWLTGYTKRIKLTTDNTKVDSTLSNFPTTVFFTSTQGEEIFTEFDADSDYMKCAFTTSDGETQLYAEKELFDHSASKAIYHVKVTSVSSSAGTDIYYYYNNSIADNTTYIGAINTTAGATVWDSNFKAVYHLNSASNAQLIDSTSNSKDSTANTLDTVAGKVSLGMDGDGAEYGHLGNIDSIGNESFVVEACFKTSDAVEAYKRLLSTYITGSYEYIVLGISDAHKLVVYSRDSNNATVGDNSPGDVNDGNWHYACLRRDAAGNLQKAYLDETEYASSVDIRIGDFTAATNEYILGANRGSPYSMYLTGQLDEVRVSSGTARSAAWAKATYNSLWDTLLTYGSEETSGAAEDNSVFFGMNF